MTFNVGPNVDPTQVAPKLQGSIDEGFTALIHRANSSYLGEESTSLLMALLSLLTGQAHQEQNLEVRSLRPIFFWSTRRFLKLSLNRDITEHAVEDGPDVSDHIRPKNISLEIEGVISSTPLQSCCTGTGARVGRRKYSRLAARRLWLRRRCCGWWFCRRSSFPKPMIQRKSLTTCSLPFGRIAGLSRLLLALLSMKTWRFNRSLFHVIKKQENSFTSAPR